MKVDLSGDLFTITTSPRYTGMMKQVPGMRYNKTQNCWTLPATLQALAWLRYCPVEYDLTPAAESKLDGLQRFGARQGKYRTDDREIDKAPHLYPFQAAGVRFMAFGKRVLLADEMGTGKTIQALSALELEGSWPALIICPNTLKHVWREEVARWTAAEPVVIEGTAAKRRQLIEKVRTLHKEQIPVICIINYESLIKHTRLGTFGNTVNKPEENEAKELNLVPWRAVVVDEAHRIKNPKAKQTRAVWGVSSIARFRYALTGTPIVNNPDDLWSVLHFLDPDAHDSRSRFRDRYCIVRPGWHGGLENLGLREEMRPELDVMVQPLLLRRTKQEVLPQLPAKILETRYLEMGTKQRRAYNQMVDHLLAEVEGGILSATDPLTLTGRLRYLASATPVLDDEGAVVSLDAPSNKADYLVELLEDGAAPLVVYAESRKLIELFDRVLSKDYTTGLITGKVLPAARQQTVEKFQNGKLDVVLATTGAGAEGITLTAAHRLVVAQESWSNVANKQAHDRIHRIGQERGVEIITLCSVGTIDESVHRAVEKKEGQLQALVRDPEWLKAAMKGEV